MNFARPSTEEASLGLTPLIDVVLLLLIFFLVTTSFRPPALPLLLPGADSATALPERRSIQIDIDRDGGLRVDGAPIAAGALAERLGRPPLAQSVVIRADRRAAHGRVVTALDAARQAGIEAVEITAEPGAER